MECGQPSQRLSKLLLVLPSFQECALCLPRVFPTDVLNATYSLPVVHFWNPLLGPQRCSAELGIIEEDCMHSMLPLPPPFFFGPMESRGGGESTYIPPPLLLENLTEFPPWLFVGCLPHTTSPPRESHRLPSFFPFCFFFWQTTFPPWESH